MRDEIMWWMSRLTIMMTSLFLSFTLAASAYAADIQMGAGGNLVFELVSYLVQQVIHSSLNNGRYTLYHLWVVIFPTPDHHNTSYP